MTTQHDTPKRFRPKFSVRTLVILVTLVCCYAACWGPTNTRGVEQFVGRVYVDANAVAPLVVARHEDGLIEVSRAFSTAQAQAFQNAVHICFLSTSFVA